MDKSHLCHLMCRDKDDLLLVHIAKITTKIAKIPTKMTKIPTKIKKIPTEITKITTKITKIPTKIKKTPTKIMKIATFSVPGSRSPYVWRHGPQYFQVLLKNGRVIIFSIK